MKQTKNLSTGQAVKIACVRGLAFAAVTALYTLIEVPLSSYLWCVYIGFFLTMALGAVPDKLLHTISSLLVGYLWGWFYFQVPGWLEKCLPFSHSICIIISEFLLTVSLLFIHLRFLQGTRGSIIPAIFAGISTLFAAGSLSTLPWCAGSAVLGILMAYVTEWMIKKL